MNTRFAASFLLTGTQISGGIPTTIQQLTNLGEYLADRSGIRQYYLVCAVEFELLITLCGQPARITLPAIILSCSACCCEPENEGFPTTGAAAFVDKAE